MTTASIIIPVYNTGLQATRLLQQIITSTDPEKNLIKDLEIILVDDGSTDDSLNILKNFSDSTTKTQPNPKAKTQSKSQPKTQPNPPTPSPKSIKLIHQKNSGPSAARNTGIMNATGKYLIFLDSDDEIAPTFIKETITAIAQQNTVLVSTGVKYHRMHKNTTTDLYTTLPPPRQKTENFKTYVLRLLLTDGRLYGMGGKVLRSDIIKNHQLKFDTTMDFAEDTKFILNYLSHAATDLATIPHLHFITKPLYTYHYGTETSLANKHSASWANWQKSFQTIKTWLGPHPTKEESHLAKKLYKKWQAACAMAIARNHANFKKKLQAARRIPHPSLLIPAIIVSKIKK